MKFGIIPTSGDLGYTAATMRFGAIIVCGGKSSRMGRPKASLPFAGEAMLGRVLRIVREAIDGPIVVVAASGQALPPMASDIVVAHDRREGRGPLEGLYVGLSRLAEPGVDCPAAYATSCDVPLLRPEFIRRVCDCLGDYAAAVPQTEGFFHPLAAIYRVAAVLPHAEALLAADRLRPAYLFERVPTRIIKEAELRAVDPQLDSLRNVNTPAEYEAAIGRAEVGRK